MARLIDADQAIAEAERLLELYNLAMAGAETNREINHVFKRQELFKAVRAVVKTCPTQDPVKHGRWIHVDELPSGDYFKCSECNHHIFLKFGWKVSFESRAYEYRYCSLCGARMDQDTGGDNNGSGEAKKE